MSNQDKIEMIECPKCERDWPKLEEQGVSILLTGQCIVCMVIAETGGTEIGPGTLREWLDKDGIITESKRLKSEAGIEIEPCPRCLQRRNHLCKVCGGIGSVYVDVSKEGQKAE